MAFSDHLGRGTEILYDGYGMKQPKALENATQDNLPHLLILKISKII